MDTNAAEGIKNQPLLRIDPELEKCLPPLDEVTYQGIKDSLAANGYDKAFPLIIWEDHDIIVDGHHRYKACVELGIEPIFVEHSFESLDDAILYALEHQDNRRNQTVTQKALNGLKRKLTQARIDARRRQAVELNRDQGALSADLREVKGRACDRVAKLVGVSARTVEQVSAVINKGVPELEDMMRDNTLTADTANTFVQVTPIEKQAHYAQQGPAAIKKHVYEVRAEKREQKARTAAANSGFEEHTKIREDLQKKHDDMAKQLGKRFGEDFETQGRVCFVEHGNMLEFWCVDCQNGFDTFIGGKDTEFCPYCGLKNIRARKPDWIPGNVGGDE